MLIPCKNEGRTISDLVGALYRALPGCVVVICDNASTDDTAAQARLAGARVVFEGTPGKGAAFRCLLKSARAPCVLMIDGDGTYPAASAPSLVGPVLRGEAEMVVGVRRPKGRGAFPPLHRIGNRFFVGLAKVLVGGEHQDILSGYRAFTQEALDMFHPQRDGFELESELTLAAARHEWRVQRVGVPYEARAQGSQSKLNTFRDGARILKVLALGARGARARP